MNCEYRFRVTGSADDLCMICLDDEAAVLLADRFAKDASVQVWDGERLVAVVEPRPVAPATQPAESRTITPESVAPRRKRFWHGAWRRGLVARGES
jgi:hypothetical protein